MRMNSLTIAQLTARLGTTRMTPPVSAGSTAPTASSQTLWTGPANQGAPPTRISSPTRAI